MILQQVKVFWCYHCNVPLIASSDQISNAMVSFPWVVILGVAEPKRTTVSRERVCGVGRASEDTISIANGVHQLAFDRNSHTQTLNILSSRVHLLVERERKCCLRMSAVMISA